MCTQISSDFQSAEVDLHFPQECLAPCEDKKISPDISYYAEHVQTPPGIMQRRAHLQTFKKKSSLIKRTSLLSINCFTLSQLTSAKCLLVCCDVWVAVATLLDLVRRR